MSFLGQVTNIAKSHTNLMIQQTLDAVLTFGKSAVHTIMPDDYEFYLCSLELYNSKKIRVGFISFVVMPDQIAESHSPIQTEVKTHGGIVTVINTTCAPVDISLAGTFGRKWRLVSNFQDPTKKKNGFLNLNFGKILGMEVGVKSGYGLVKLLDKILQKSQELDDYGKPHFLTFNNYSFNTAYIVNVSNYTYSQSYEQNMIWNYQLNLRAVGYKPSSINKKGNLLGTVASNAISSGLTKIISGMIGI